MISKRLFGIEYEHVSNLDYGELAALLAQANINVDPDGIRRTNPAYSGWQVKSDGSITTCAKYQVPIELVTPPITLLHLPEITRALKIAKEHGGVNASCGLHVHVHAPELVNPVAVRPDTEYMNYIAKCWRHIEPVMFSYCPPSRRTASVCRSGVEWNTKYKAINFSPLHTSKHTVEFRLHSATLNPIKSIAFAALCVAFIDFIVKRGPLGKILPDYQQKHVKQAWITTHSGNEIGIMRDNGIWLIKDKKLKIEAPTLSEAWKFKADLSIKAPHYLPGFHYPMHGNAMSQLCAALGVRGMFRGFLEDRYEKLVKKHGVVGATIENELVMRDEADFFSEANLHEGDDPPLQEQLMMDDPSTTLESLAAGIGPYTFYPGETIRTRG